MLFPVATFGGGGWWEFYTKQEITNTTLFLYIQKVKLCYRYIWRGLGTTGIAVWKENNPTAIGLSSLQNYKGRKIVLFISIMFEFITISPYNVHSLNIILLGIFLHNYPCIMFLTGNGEEILSCLVKCGDGIFSFNQPTQMLPLLYVVYSFKDRDATNKMKQN